MKNKSYNNPLLDSTAEHITERPCIKKVSVSILAIIAGVALITTTQVSIEDSASSTYMAMMTLGVILTLVYIIKLFWSSKEIVYVPTKSPIKNYSVYFKTGDIDSLMSAIQSGNIEKLNHSIDANKAGLRMDVVVSKDQNFAACQLYRYIPHNYQPASIVYNIPNEHLNQFCPFVQRFE